jgi:hypothetical protein
MAARLESATKQYGVSILMSADFAAILSLNMRSRCREIDVVLVKGSSQPMGIWTIDLDTRFISSDGRKACDVSELFVHNTATDPAWIRADVDEFELHPDVQASFAVNREFLQTWRVWTILCHKS